MRPEESFIGQPVRSLQTMLRVIAQCEDQIPLLIPDGFYGRQTMAAVSAFQQAHDLPVTGVANQQTWDKIAQAYASARIQTAPAEPIQMTIGLGQVICRGQASPCVSLAQCMLGCISRLYPCIGSPAISGKMDEDTCACLSNFQKFCGISESGELDKLCWRHLCRQYSQAADTLTRLE